MIHEGKNLQDLKTIEHLASNGITMTPDKHDMFSWNVSMKGPKGTPYEGGLFQLVFTATKDYPYALLLFHLCNVAILTSAVPRYSPPSVTFLTE